MKTNPLAIYGSWRTAWQSKPYKISVIVGLILVAAVLTCLAFFFVYVENRDGAVLNDRLLSSITPVDVSYPLLFFIWTTALLAVYRAVSSPVIFLRFLYAYIIVTASRIMTMYLMPLNPPPGLIPITDPLSNILYGSKFVTKDLFYSGHTATLMLIYLHLEKKADRFYGLLSTICVGILVIIQHVHYIIDVVSAPFFTYCFYLLASKITNPILYPSQKKAEQIAHS